MKRIGKKHVHCQRHPPVKANVSFNDIIHNASPSDITVMIKDEARYYKRLIKLEKFM